MTKSEKKIVVKQVRSAIGRPPGQIKTLACLGLGRIGRVSEHTLSPSVMGMVRKIWHLVEVQETSK